jgi:2-polyprenyl-3-methyl-5-hydroxy-6-metoxy-1,4-benzoquinol methylase
MTIDVRRDPRATAEFGPAYFRRFYLDPRTRVVTPAAMRGRARLIAAVLSHAEIPVRTILDAGCGVGMLRKPFAEILPRARYTGLDAS